MLQNQLLQSRARTLRANMTPAERILRADLRDRRFSDFKFRRQHVLGPYIVDFYCDSIALVLELDGETHVGRELQDQARQHWLETNGYRVLRFWNGDVYDDHDVVLEAIWHECDSRRYSVALTPGPSPAEPGEGGQATIPQFHRT